MNGSFALPMKFTRDWEWENTWLVFSIFALVVFPPLLTFLTLPGLGQVYEEGGAALILVVAGCGVGWGVAQVFFGLAVNAVGIALSFSIVLGLSAVVGSLVPLIRFHPEKIVTPGGMAVIGGVILLLLGVGICAVAGRRREAVLGMSAGKPSVKKGILFCVLSGLGAALVNLGLAFGQPLLEIAEAAGAATVWAANAVWMPLTLAGSIPNIAYCAYLMRKNGTTDRYGRTGTGSYWALAALMGVFWFGSVVLYGVSAGKLGELGTVLGWPLFMSLIVITATVWGILTGEWKGTGRRPLQVMMGGVAVLVVAIFVLAAASRMV